MKIDKAIKWINRNAPSAVVGSITSEIEGLNSYIDSLHILKRTEPAVSNSDDIKRMYHDMNSGIEDASDGLVYLGTPYSSPSVSVKDIRYQIVNILASHFFSMGEDIFSPITHGHTIVNAPSNDDIETSWEIWEKYDAMMLSFSSKMYVVELPGWKSSIGLTAEIEIAKKIGFPIVHIPIEYIELVLSSVGINLSAIYDATDRM